MDFISESGLLVRDVERRAREFHLRRLHVFDVLRGLRVGNQYEVRDKVFAQGREVGLGIAMTLFRLATLLVGGFQRSVRFPRFVAGLHRNLLPLVPGLLDAAAQAGVLIVGIDELLFQRANLRLKGSFGLFHGLYPCPTVPSKSTRFPLDGSHFAGNGEETMKTGIELIAEERQRQVAVEGWTPDHDAKHSAGELAMAAVCYALPSFVREGAPSGQKTTYYLRFWPWEHEWWKPTPEDRVRELTKAGALIAAEIDRLQRASK